MNFRKFYFCFHVAICDLVHDVESIHLQFHSHHSYFRKDFQMLLAVMGVEVREVKYSLQIMFQVTHSNNKAKIINLKKSKKLTTKTILRCTPCKVCPYVV